MGAFANLGSFFGENLVTIAKKCGYHQSNILILEGKIEQLQNEYPNVYKALNSCTINPAKCLKVDHYKGLIKENDLKLDL